MKTRFAGLVAVSMLAAIAVAAPLRADEAAAKQNYTTFCAKCHGATGKGDGEGAATLKTKPRDFADCTRMASITDDTMFNVIKNGGPAAGLSADMTAWKAGLEDAEIKDLIAYIRKFCKK